MSETDTAPSARAALPAVMEGESPADISRARDAADAFARSLEPALSAQVKQTLALVVTELATNALRHGGGRFTMRLSVGTNMVNIAMSDPSPVPPRERAPDLNGGTGGFGWHMIRRLAIHVALAPGPGVGKTIYVGLLR
ncbi:ATP-binding protein [Streptomyces sp. NPDC056529]|uniref:ATP-binding protein n=1 Tax=Streptomyces sp. NPDC056529 TaxID=3345855 RepID=UPI0036CEF365